MKRLLIAAVLVSGANVALADQDVGCGLGSMIWAGQSGLVPKVLAATSNTTVGLQTFGITTGTLGCSKDGVITSRAKLGMFMGNNIDRLAQEMSVGQGEHLNILADLMGVKDEHKAQFFRTTRSHFGEIFAADKQTAGDVLDALRGVMSRDDQLASYAA